MELCKTFQGTCKPIVLIYIIYGRATYDAVPCLVKSPAEASVFVPVGDSQEPHRETPAQTNGRRRGSYVEADSGLAGGTVRSGR